MSMTRREFEKVAEAVRAMERRNPKLEGGTYYVARILAEFLSDLNPRFDREWFVSAATREED